MAVRVFIACSLDGFIAGPGDDLSWLPPPGDDDHGYGAFMAGVGAILMGRKTYDVAAGFDGPWPYGDVPVLVATSRPLSPKADTVTAVRDPIAALVARARALAGDKDVYLDGGNLIRQALDAGLLDTLTVTLVPVILGAGSPLFAGAKLHVLERLDVRASSHGLVQVQYRLTSGA